MSPVSVNYSVYEFVPDPSDTSNAWAYIVLNNSAVLAGALNPLAALAGFDMGQNVPGGGQTILATTEDIDLNWPSKLTWDAQQITLLSIAFLGPSIGSGVLQTGWPAIQTDKFAANGQWNFAYGYTVGFTWPVHKTRNY
ncbi:MAG TPA: hypothetical protein VE779_16200 [Candidatus Angelobacter sp.]|jgi:hypothetical protein|nr:hypothetical protein [Candidatus Angelobacter sp.]